MSAGELLQRGRVNAGLSQRQLARRAGVSHVYIGNIERGQAIPRPWRLEMLAQLLGVDGAAVVDAARTEVVARAIASWRATP